MSWDGEVYIDECTKVWEGSKITTQADGSTLITFRNGSVITLGLSGVTGSAGKILLMSGEYLASNYLPEEPQEMKAIDMRIYKVKCRSCKGNYILKDHNSIFFTKCKLCGSGKLQYDK